MGIMKASTGKLRDKLLNRKFFYTLKKAWVLIKRCSKEYNTIRPHGSLNYRLPALQILMLNTLNPFILNSEQDGTLTNFKSGTKTGG